MTDLQVPTEPLTSQASHCPEQAKLQQTPSAQLPDAHSVPPAQAWPLDRSTQVPLLQRGLVAVVQSALVQQFAAGMHAPLHCL